MGGPDSQDAAFSSGTVLDDKFRIERVLGVGGMGAVYEVTHLLTRHRRALKLLHPQYATRKTPVERFFREASAAGHIGHANIIETFDAGWLSSGEPYLVMELLDGRSLADRLDETEGRGMAIDELVEVFSQLCDGVQAAHDAGIVHRDLKPENVFLAGEGGDWRVKILDFGVSKFDEKLATKLTSGGSFVGTPAYMSPEQFERGAEVDARSDVYALGVIAYEMAAGVHPFPATTMMQLARMIMLSDPRSLREVRPEMPGVLEALIARAMARDPEERVATARELALRIRAIGEDCKLGLHHQDSASAPHDAVSGVHAITRETIDRPMESMAPSTVVIEPEEDESESPSGSQRVSETLPSAGQTEPPVPIAAPRRWLGGVALVVVASTVAIVASRTSTPADNGASPGATESATPPSAPPSQASAPTPAPTPAPTAAPSATVRAPVPSMTTLPLPRPLPPTLPRPTPSTERAGDDEWGPSKASGDPG